MNNRAYVALTGEYESENAVDPQFDFDGLRLAADLQVPLPGIENAEANFRYSYRTRDYDNITPSIGEPREEDRSRFESGVEIPIVANLAFEAEYQYTDRNSNLPSADYNEHLIAAVLKYQF